ncbi:hypothetical protein [Cupriavidus taiwanensis]|uniref:Uncharacterized protein n=1 Tax=Cupriavidus taiwanensis (strain DSM 17343 / BCRC 17206 / CCUG 44338 / CIP 107171 / LMG 19424 / R1) TaxID=977880 RepID=B3R9L7_CUPTR|nr:hypothetical protein RALTA_B0981 [Cupriavidus taiwanensis LMG 19424]
MTNLIADVSANDQAVLDDVLNGLEIPGTEGEVAGLLADLNLDPDDIVEPALPSGDEANAAILGKSTMQAAVPALPAPVAPLIDANAIDEAALVAAVQGAEKQEALQALYAEQEPALPTSAGDAPATEEVQPMDPAKPKRQASHNPLRSTSAKKSEKLVARLGEQVSEYLVLEMSDATLPPEELKAKQDALMAMLDMSPTNIARANGQAAVQKKVADKALMLFGWIKNGGELNEIMRRTFTVLHRDGFLTSGEKGNLQLDLLAKPYSLGTARAQSSQMFALLPLLKIAIREKGKMIANPDSALLPQIKARLALQ